MYLYDLTTHAFVFSEATPGAFQFQGALEASHSYQFTAYARALDRTGGSGSYEYDNAYANFDFAVGTQPVPEPGTLALVGLGAAGLAAHRRRRRRRRYHARA